MKRICIVGPSGTGKTDLAKYIASRYRIPFISSSSKCITKEKGINSHKELIHLCSNKPQEALSTYKAILNYREGIMDDNSSFVTDRGIPDLIVYAHLQLVPHIDDKDSLLLLQQSIDIITDQEVHYIFLPYANIPIENDSHRITSMMYQSFVSSCFDLVIKKFIPDNNLTIINVWDWEARVKIIDNIFKPKSELEKWQNAIIKFLKRNQ